MIERINLRKRAKETLDDVSAASNTVVSTTQWATVALVVVTTLSVLALAVSVVALKKVTSEQ